MKTRQLKLLGIALVALLSFTLTACHKPPPPPALYALTPYQKNLVSGLRHSGVRVIKQGEVLQIIIPTDRFFRSQTTRLRRNRVNAVNRIAALVKSYTASYRRPRVRVSGYTDTVFARRSRHELSRQYAKVIAAYLWNNGVPQKWVRVRGHGALHPIAPNTTVRGAAYNRRVMIQIN